MQGNKFLDLVNYFKQLADEHVDINGFYRYELDEVLTELSNFKVPCLILEGYKFKFTDNKSDNVIKTRSGAFILLDHVNDIGDYAKIHETWDALEVTGDEILARIREDKRARLIPIMDFDIESVEGQPLASEISQYYGMRYTFDIGCKFNADVTESKWQRTTT